MKKIIIILVAAIVLIFAGCSREPNTVEELRSAGKKAFLEQKYVEARKFFNKALMKTPSDADILYFNGLCYKRDYIYDSALIFIKRADLINKDNAEINREILDLSQRVENWEYAIRALWVLIKLGEPIEKHYKELAKFAAMGNKPLEAYSWQKKVVESDSTDINEYLRLIGTALAIDSLNDAKLMIDRGKIRFGENNDLTNYEAQLLLQQKKYVEAEKMFRGFLAQDSSNIGNRINLANALSMQNNKDKKREALSIYKSVPRSEDTKPFKIDSLMRVLENELTGGK